MPHRKAPERRHSRAIGVLTALAVIACLAMTGHLFKDRIVKFLSPPPRASVGLLNAAVDSACASLETRKATSSTVILGEQEITQDRLELPGKSSMLRANLIITRAVERAGGKVAYGIESVDEKRRWQTVTLGVSDGDSLIREVRLEKRLR